LGAKVKTIAERSWTKVVAPPSIQAVLENKSEKLKKRSFGFLLVSDVGEEAASGVEETFSLGELTGVGSEAKFLVLEEDSQRLKL